MHVNVYLDSESAFVSENRKIEALYPLEYFNRFKPGQTGNFYIDKHRWPEFQPLHVGVENITIEGVEKKVRLILTISDGSEKTRIIQGMKGKAVLMIGMKSPYELFLNQLGKKIPGNSENNDEF